jgi:hypothetical protein
MWGKYYLCGACGFTAEDDDDLRGEFGKPTLSAGPDLTQVEAHPPRQTSARD